MIWAAVMAGGALGSLARHLVNAAITRAFGQSVPWAVATVNITGCAIIGVLAGALAAQRVQLSVPARAFVFVGVLGGYTTFSSFGLDTLTLVREGQALSAFLNVTGQVVVGIAAVFAGYAIGAR